MKTLSFDARLYPRAVVQKAAADFGEAAELAVAEERGSVVVEIRALKADIAADEFAGEFSNYVLGMLS